MTLRQTRPRNRFHPGADHPLLFSMRSDTRRRGPGRLPERPKGADCKSAGSAFEGSNPSPATPGEDPGDQHESWSPGSSAFPGFGDPKGPAPGLPSGRAASPDVLPHDFPSRPLSEPYESVEVTAEIEVPEEDVTEREHYAVRWAQSSAPPDSENNVGSVQRVGVRVHLSVGSGKETPSDFEMTEVTAERDEEGRPGVSARIDNTGGRAVDRAARVAKRLVGTGGHRGADLSRGGFHDHRRSRQLRGPTVVVRHWRRPDRFGPGPGSARTDTPTSEARVSAKLTRSVWNEGPVVNATGPFRCVRGAGDTTCGVGHRSRPEGVEVLVPVRAAPEIRPPRTRSGADTVR